MNAIVALARSFRLDMAEPFQHGHLLSRYWGDLLSPDMGKHPFHGGLVDVDTEPTPVATVNY